MLFPERNLITRGRKTMAALARVLSRPLARRAALRPLCTAASDVEQSFSLALSEEQQAFKEAVRRGGVTSSALAHLL